MEQGKENLVICFRGFSASENLLKIDNDMTLGVEIEAIPKSSFEGTIHTDADALLSRVNSVT